MNKERQKNVNANANENASIERWGCGHDVSKSSHVRHHAKRRANESYWTCENAKNAKDLPFMMYGVIC